jgi:Zn finger protein HypA/HybF involved in hydrogenase expression
MKELLDIICVEAGSDSEAKFSINIVVSYWRCLHCDTLLIGERTGQGFGCCPSCTNKREERKKRMKEDFERLVQNFNERGNG